MFTTIQFEINTKIGQNRAPLVTAVQHFLGQDEYNPDYNANAFIDKLDKTRTFRLDIKRQLQRDTKLKLRDVKI